MSTLLHNIDHFPHFTPVECRMLAVIYPVKQQGRSWPVAMSEAQIVALSHLSVGDVRCLSLLNSWDDVPVRKMRAFIKGCRLNLGNYRALERLRRMIRRGEFSHLRRSPEWESKLMEVFNTWNNSATHV